MRKPNPKKLSQFPLSKSNSRLHRLFSCSLVFIAFLFMSLTGTGQQRKLTGVVQESKNNSALIGATISVKGNNASTVTGDDGKFSIEVPNNAVIEVSYTGYISKEIAVGSQTNLTIQMEESVSGLNEVVVVGYGTQKKSSVTGSIATMKADEVLNEPLPNLSNGLAGRLAGVYVNQGSGAPGYASHIRVRSVNTWKGSGNDPLFVIDGVISDKKTFDALDYSEVDNITVLKDAASGAIYGARAANGVLLVTTKSGKAGVFKLNYNYSYTFDNPSKIPDYVGAADMVRLNNYARVSEGIAPLYDEQEVAYFNANDPGKAWYKLAYRDPTLQKHTVSASGGSEKIRYFLSGSSFDQTAFVKNADYTKYNIRSNIDVDFTKNISGTFKFSYNTGVNKRFAAQEDLASGFETQPEFGGTWGRLLYYLSDVPPVTSDGHLINPGWIGNMLAMIEEGGTFTRTERNIDLQMGLTYKVPFINGLSLSGKLSPNYKSESIKLNEYKTTLYNVIKHGTNGKIFTDSIVGSIQSSYPNKERLVKEQRTNNNYQLNFSANYLKTFGNHNIEAVLVYEQSEGTFDDFSGVREGFPLIQRDQFWATSNSRNDSYVNGTESQYGRASYIGRVTYNYAEKYFINLITRRDGSMLFAPNYRWGTFPSVSAGWVVSKEDFFKVKSIDFLKLRGSWGLAGNDAVGGWEWSESYSANGSYLFGTTPQPRIVYNGITNPKLTWEKTREVNIGLDARFLNGFILSADYYKRRNYDILDTRIASLPVSFGGSMPPENYGIVNGQGWELELGYNNSIGQVSYEVKGNFSYATNKVIKRDVAQNAQAVDNPNGLSTDYIGMLVSSGIIRTQKDLDALPAGYTIYGLSPALGALNFQDVSGIEGKPDGKIDDYDRQILNGKHYNNPYTFGLSLNANWKGFGVGVFLQGLTGVSKLYNDGYGRKFFDGARPPSFWLDSWNPDNTNAAYPKPVTWGYTYDDLPSTFWLKNGNFLRLQFVNLSYSLPKSICQKIRINDVSFIVSATNLFTLTKFDYYDPSVASMNSYPTMKSYTMGVNVKF